MNRKITDAGVAGLPLAEGRAELLEEIMRTPSVTVRPRRPLLAPLAAAAAVVAIAGGAWALSAGEEPETSPEGPGFGSAPTTEAETPSVDAPEEVPSGQWDDTCVVAYEQGSTPPATDGPELDHCDTIVLDEQGPVEEVERYQRPPRPVLITADGWEPEDVFGLTVTWRGPGGERVHMNWVQTASPDPFAYDRYERRGERIDILGIEGRLTSFTERGDFQVLLTAPVEDGGPGLLLETSALGPEEFRALVESLQWVSLDEYADVVRPAVD